MLFKVETRKKIFKNIIFKNYQRNFTLPVKRHPKTSFFLNIMSEYMLRVHIIVVNERR